MSSGLAVATVILVQHRRVRYLTEVKAAHLQGQGDPPAFHELNTALHLSWANHNIPRRRLHKQGVRFPTDVTLISF
jgi:hypothetical protein